MSIVDVAIVGGGVIGLSAAYVLAGEGATVAVLDRGELGKEASWAGAGILAPLSERPAANPLAALRAWSVRLHAEWAGALREATGIDNGHRLCGGVDVALDEAEERSLRADAGRWRAEGIAFERMEPRDLPRVEPALGPAVRVGYFLPERAQIRNPRHVRALVVACERLGVRLCPGLAAEGLDVLGDRVAAVRTAGGPLPCGHAVVAAGAWTEGLLAPLNLDVPTPPIKGQIVLLKGERPALRRIVEHGKRYLVPRDDGRILVGATEEDAGFDTRPTPPGVVELLGEALRLCPGLADLEVERAWAGLRPGNRDERPTIGRAPGLVNLTIATGHRRAGLQLSTGTALLVADLVLDRPPRLDVAPFLPGRAPAPPAADAFRS